MVMALPNWLYMSQTAGTSGTTTITVSADTNSIESMLYCFPFINSGDKKKKVFIAQDALSGNTTNNINNP